MNEDNIGRQIMTELMGADYVKLKDEKRNDFNAAFLDYSEEVCFGRIWSREGLDRKTRCMLNLALLTVLNRAQLGFHVEAAIKNGCSAEEIREVLLHTTMYSGLPAGSEAFRVAEEVLRSHNLV